MAKIEIRGESGRHISIEVYGYENVHADNYYDANWLCCSVLLELGNFRGEADASFLASDFSRFLSEFELAIDERANDATFQTIEDLLRLNVKLDRTGHAEISGMLRESPGSYTELSFRFESDQSFLAPARTQLRKIVADFPGKQMDGAGE